jgi:hypothetical protein
MLETIGNTLTLGTTIGIALTILVRIIPNEKIFSWGVATGKFLDGIGSIKMGSVVWDKVEHFLVNSVGEYLRGVKSGLGEDE